MITLHARKIAINALKDKDEFEDSFLCLRRISTIQTVHIKS